MERIEISIETVNVAFERSNYELVRILRELADKIADDNIPSTLRDINGNRVGEVEVY